MAVVASGAVTPTVEVMVVISGGGAVSRPDAPFAPQETVARLTAAINAIDRIAPMVGGFTSTCPPPGVRIGA